MRIVDTHLHLVYRSRFSYPWMESAPALNRDWTAEAYWTEARPLGIEAALHMEVDVAEEQMEAETRFVLGLDPGVVGAIAAGRPEHESFPGYLERIAALPGVKGLRRILHTLPDSLSQSDLFAQNVRRLAQHGLTFDLCVQARQLPIARALVGKCPEVQFVLDHCGVPDITGAGLEPWRAEIRETARLPNIAAKISGIVAYGAQDWSAETLRPYVEHVIECFGWDRVVWGSDHPVCTQRASLTEWVEATRAVIAGTAADEQAKLLHRNAERIYRIARPAS